MASFQIRLETCWSDGDFEELVEFEAVGGDKDGNNDNDDDNDEEGDGGEMDDDE